MKMLLFVLMLTGVINSIAFVFNAANGFPKIEPWMRAVDAMYTLALGVVAASLYFGIERCLP